MIAARAYGLRSFLVVYKQEALIPIIPIAIDMILFQSWDSICDHKRAYTEELVAMLWARSQRWLKGLGGLGKRKNVGMLTI